MNLEADASVYKQKAPTLQPAPALSSPLAHTGSLARISHSSPPPPTSKTKRAPFRLPPIQPYLTLPTQPKSTHSLTTHSPLTNQPTNQQPPIFRNRHSPIALPVRIILLLPILPSPLAARQVAASHQTTKHITTPSIQPQAPSTQMEKKRGVEGRDWPSVAPTPAPAWSLRRRAPHLNSPCLALSLPAPFFALLFVRC
jgi:hypothetical protein